jgi:Domain of unknown function (DUF4340)
MSKKSLIVLWSIVALLIVGVVSLTSKKADSGEANTNRTRGQTLMESFPAKDVASIKISGFEQSVTLVKKDGDWTVAEREDYPANTGTINNLLRTIEDVKINNAIEAGPTYAKRFGLDLTAKTEQDHGTELTFLNAKNENIATIFLGKEAEGGGRFIQNAADTSGIYVTSESFPTATASAKDWLNDEFLKVEKIKSITITSAGKPEQTEWKVTRSDENAEFSLAGAQAGETIDEAVSSQWKTLLSMARFQDVALAKEFSGLAASADRQIATIETVDGFTYTITIVPKPAAPAKPAAEGEPPAAEEKAYYIAVKVDGVLAKERTKAADEKPEDAKAKDEEFAKTSKMLADKLKAEQGFQGRAYEVSYYVIDSLLKSRADILTKATPPSAGPEMPPGFSPSLRQSVTPPISIDGQ